MSPDALENEVNDRNTVIATETQFWTLIYISVSTKEKKVPL